MREVGVVGQVDLGVGVVLHRLQACWQLLHLLPET
jgi:hypothetical protein